MSPHSFAVHEQEQTMNPFLSWRKTAMLRRLSLVSLALCLPLAPSISPAAANGPRPFHGAVTAVWDNVFDGLFAPPANFAGGGPVTHMGDTKQSGTLTLEAPVGPGIFPGSGSVTITAANGDKL